MTAKDWAQVKSVFGRALEQPASERTSWLDAQPDLERPIREEVLRLLAEVTAGEVFEVGLAENKAAEEQHPHQLTPGEVLLDRFEVLAFLGAGGMGEVYSAYDSVLSTRVALKCIHPAYAERPELLRQLRREVQYARKVRHDHVCAVHDLHRVDRDGKSITFLSMELLEGPTLSDYLRNHGPMNTAQLQVLTEQLASGLAAIHAQDVIHRDFKSGNIILAGGVSGSKLRAVILDFGLSRQNTTDLSLTQSVFGPEAVVGTPMFMAPELFDQGRATAQSDIYALGAVLFHAATGRMPFEGETALAIALKKVSEIAPRARTYRKELPGIWDEVIDRCLEKKPENRPQSANEVLRISRGKPTFRPTRRKVIAGSIAAGVAVAAGAGGIWYGTRKEIPAEALTAFKRGEEFLRRRDEQGLADAVDEFTTAIKIYPEYAEAWASLADAHAAQVHYVFANSAEALKKAEDAAVRALQLNNSLAKAHGALAFVRAADLQRWPEADALFRSAVYNYPNEALLLAWYASYLGRVGRHDEAIGHAQRAVKLEPGSSYFNLQLAVEYWRGLRLDEHLKQARETVRMHPKEYNAHLSLARALEWHRRFEEAEKALDVARMYDARERGRAYWVTLRAAQGRTAEARQHAEVIRKLWDAYTPEGKQDMHIEANVMVSVFASLADVGAVVAVLKTGIERKDSTVLAAATNPYMRELRRESVVREQLARVGLDRVYRA